MSEEKKVDDVKVDDSASKEIAELRREAAQRRIENKELADKLAGIEAKAAKDLEDKLAEQGEFKTLAEQLKAQLAEKEAKLLESDAFISKVKEREEAELASLLEKVPENLRVHATKMAASDAIAYCRDIITTKESPAGYRPPGEQGGKNLMTRQAFDALPPSAKGKFLSDGGRVHD